jgi:hypothetical protein
VIATMLRVFISVSLFAAVNQFARMIRERAAREYHASETLA